MLEHLIFTKEVWLAAIEGAEFPAERGDDPGTLIERHDAVAPRWLGTVRDIERRGGWDDRLIDALCDPPESFVMSSVIAHVITYAAHRRQLARHLIRAGGHEADDGDPINWLRRQRGEDTGPMTKGVFYTATTLDGYIADENDSLDWLFVQDQDENGPLNYDDFIEGIGAIVMGRTTYEWVLAHLQKTGEKLVVHPALLGVHARRPRADRRQRHVRLRQARRAPRGHRGGGW